MSINRFPILVLGLLFVQGLLRAEVSKVDLQDFQQQCQTSFNEPWRTIPWKISLLEAQRIAANDRKPIYIWAMDGHPLGCT